MSKVIVTGGAGFIGSHLVEKLIKLGHTVLVIDDLSTGKKSNLSKKVQLFKYGLSLKTPLLKKIPDSFLGTTYLYHLAALPRIERSIADPLGTHSANVDGTLAALEIARKLKVKKFFYTSSSSVYGNQKVLPLKEIFTPNPQNPYAFQKLMGEYLCKIYNQYYNLPVIIFRLFNVYGSRMLSKGSYKLVFTRWLEQIKNKKPLTIYGSGKQTRDFTFISDVVEALTHGINIDKKITYQTINIGYGRQININYLAKLFHHPIEYLPVRPFEEKFKQADIKTAKKILNWKPLVSIEEGVEKLMADFNSTHLANR